MTMEKKSSNTPVIVGSVIAIIGILVGLYFAENANERLAQYNDGARQDSIEAPQAVVSASPDNSVAPMPLEPIDIDIPEMDSQQEEPLPEIEDTDNANEASTPAPPDAHANTTPANTEEEVTVVVEGEVDDFEEVDPAEEERRAAQQETEQ